MGHFKILKNLNYRFFFTSQIIALTGYWVLSVTTAWIALHLTSSASWMGVIQFCNGIAIFVLSPIAGFVGDHTDRRKILRGVIFSTAFIALLLALLSKMNWVSVWLLMGVNLLIGVVNAFDINTRHAFSGDIVPKNELASAIAVNGIIMNGSRVIGPVAAGVLLDYVREFWCFTLTAFLMVPAYFSFRRIKREGGARSFDANSDLGIFDLLKKVHTGVLAGIQYCMSDAVLIRLLMITGAVAISACSMNMVIPILAKLTFKANGRVMGMLSGAMGVGAIFGSLAFRSKNSLQKLKSGLVFDLLGWALALCLVSFSKTPEVAMFTVMLCGFFMMKFFPTVNTALQTRSDERFRGRVIGLYSMSFFGGVPIGNLLAGWVCDHYGTSAYLLGSAVATALVALGLWLLGFHGSPELSESL